MAGTRRTSQRRLGRPPDVDSNETRAALVVGARRAFATHGYEATTNRMISAAADVTAGAIYHYFASKADLYVAVYTELQDVFVDAFETATQAGETMVDRYCAMLDAAVELNRQDSSMAGFLVMSASDLRAQPELRARLADQVTRSTSLVGAMAAEAVQRGELGEGVDPRALEDLLTLVLSGIARFANLTGDPDRHEAAVDILKRFLRGQIGQLAAVR